MEYHATLRELLELDAISQTTLAETLGWTVALCFMIFEVIDQPLLFTRDAAWT